MTAANKALFDKLLTWATRLFTLVILGVLVPWNAWLGLRVIEFKARVAVLEHQARAVEAKTDADSDVLASLRQDVAFIRGKIEGRIP